MLKDHPPPPTDPELLGVLEELIKREPIFHRPEFGTTRADFENMTSPDFWEIGASGRRYKPNNCAGVCACDLPDAGTEF